jgi:hypothetical protein
MYQSRKEIIHIKEARLRVLCIYQLMLLHGCPTVPSSGKVYIFHRVLERGRGRDGMAFWDYCPRRLGGEISNYNQPKDDMLSPVSSAADFSEPPLYIRPCIAGTLHTFLIIQ